MNSTFPAPPGLRLRIEYDTRSDLARFFSWDTFKNLFGVTIKPKEANRRLAEVADWVVDAKRWLRRAESAHPSALSLDAIAQVESHAGEARGVVLRLLNKQPDIYRRTVPDAPLTAWVLPDQTKVKCPCPPMTLALEYHAAIIEADVAKVEQDAHILFLRVQDWRARRAEGEAEEWRRRCAKPE